MDRRKVSNMNFQLYQSVNSYRNERTVAPVDSGQSGKVRNDTLSGNGDYVVYNVQNGTMHHRPSGSTQPASSNPNPNLGLNYRSIANAQRKHARSRTADNMDARSSSESLDRPGSQDDKKQKHSRSKSADPYEKLNTKPGSKKESQETKEKPKSTSRLLFMRSKLKKKDSDEKKEEKDKATKAKSRKGSGKSATKTEAGKSERGQQLLDMQFPCRDYDDSYLNESCASASGSRQSSVTCDDDVFSQNCDVHLNGNQVPRPLHQSLTTEYSMSYDQITQPASGKQPLPPQGAVNLVSRSHDQLPQRPFTRAQTLSCFGGAATRDPETPGYGVVTQNRRTRPSRPRAMRSQTITLDSRDALPPRPTYNHDSFNTSAHALALSGSSTVVTKDPVYAPVHSVGYNPNRATGDNNTESFSEENSRLTSNSNYSDPYSNSSYLNNSSGVQSQNTSNYFDVYASTKSSSQMSRNQQTRVAEWQQQQPGSHGNYADVYHQGDPTTTRSGYQATTTMQLEQIPELNENTATLKRGARNNKGKLGFVCFQAARFSARRVIFSSRVAVIFVMVVVVVVIVSDRIPPNSEQSNAASARISALVSTDLFLKTKNCFGFESQTLSWGKI